MGYRRDLGLRDFCWSKELTLRGNLNNLKIALKRAKDRLWTGIDRFAYWSMDFFYFEHMLEALTVLRYKRFGSPPAILPCEHGYTDENGEVLLCGSHPTPEICDQDHLTCNCHTLWNAELDKVIGWLKEWLEYANDLGYPEKEKCIKLEEKIFDWFKKYWENLWD